MSDNSNRGSSSRASNSTTTTPHLQQQQPSETPSRRRKSTTNGRSPAAAVVTSTVSISGLHRTTDIQDRAQSRNTLSRHLSQSNLTAPVHLSGPPNPSSSKHVQQRTRSTSINSAASSSLASSHATFAGDDSLNGNSAAAAAASLGRRRPSAASLSLSTTTATRSTLSRSPSYGLVPRKSSLAIPQLSSIEGSVSNLQQEADRWSSPQRSLPQTHSHERDAVATIPDLRPSPAAKPAAAEAMNKRPLEKEESSSRRTDEAANTQHDQEEQQVKRKKSWLEGLGTPGQPVKRGDEDSSIIPIPHNEIDSSAPLNNSRPSCANSQDGWIAYLTRRRSVQPMTAPGTDGSEVVPATNAAPNSQLERQPPASDATIAVTPSVVEQTTTTAKPVNVDISAEDGIPASSDQVPAETISARESVLAKEPSSTGMPRSSSSSWWFWPAANTPAGPHPATSGSNSLLPGSEEPSLGLRAAVDQNAAESSAPGIADPESSEAGSAVMRSASTVTVTPTSTSNAASNTWSAWLGSYLAGSGAAGTTPVTYAAGLTPSSDSAVMSSAASIASTVVPEADETFPEQPTETPDASSASTATLTPKATLHPRNPLLDAVPLSSWSSFFTSRYAYPIKKIEQASKADLQTGPEVMEVDFNSTDSEDKRHSSDERCGDATAPEIITDNGIRINSAATSTQAAHQPQKLRMPAVLPMSAAAFLPIASTSSAMVQNPSTVSAANSTISSYSASKPLTTDPKSAKGKTPAKASSRPPTPRPPRPNLVLPSFEDTFLAPPRVYRPVRSSPSPSPSLPSRQNSSTLQRAAAKGFTWLFSSPPRAKRKVSSSSTAAEVPSSPTAAASATLPAGSGAAARPTLSPRSERLPKSLSVLGESQDLGKKGRICIIGVRGWSVQSYLKNVVGEPTGSVKFTSMLRDAVKTYYSEQGHDLNDEAITTIPLEGDGTVSQRLARLYNSLMSREEWIEALNTSDRVFIVSHSQGCIVSTMLLSRLINEGEVNGTRCAMLQMCGVSQGPFVSLYNSLTSAYLYLETAAARELFEFQKPNSQQSKDYMDRVHHVLNAGVKLLLVASLNDQVVPLYSSLFSSLSHPSMLRAIFIDSQAFETSADFMTNLVVFATRLRNAGLNAHGLDFHLSEALAGSLMGVGHSSIYDEPQIYRLAVRFALETSGPLLEHTPSTQEELFDYEPFDPRVPANPFFLPWALRGILEDTEIRSLFSKELDQLRAEFENWNPKTKALQQVKMALMPLQGIPKPQSSREGIRESAETGRSPDVKHSAKL